jgi:hypothetical protein
MTKRTHGLCLCVEQLEDRCLLSQLLIQYGSWTFNSTTPDGMPYSRDASGINATFSGYSSSGVIYLPLEIFSRYSRSGY